LALPLATTASSILASNVNLRIALISSEPPIAWWLFIRVSLMPFYRAYLLDTSGRVGPAHHLVCESDDEAIERARRRVGLHPFVLWNEDRLVFRLEGRRMRAARGNGLSKRQ